jgi:drug/metabolite transporter (DMT)-like permease
MSYLILVSVIWGFSFVLIKGTLGSLDANFVSLVRLLLSFIVFLPLLRLRGLRRADCPQLLVIGGIQFGLMYVAYVASYQYLPAHVVALMTTTTPLFITGINDFRAKRIHKAFFFAALLAVAGGAVIELPHQPLSANLRGIALIQLSNAAFAFGQLAYRGFMRSRPGMKDTSIFGVLYAGAVIVAGAFSLVSTNYQKLNLQAQQVLALLYLGVVASGFCFFWWNIGARRVNEGILAVMNNLKIPVAVFASLLILGEVTDFARLLAGCGLFAAALWVNRRFSIAGQ